MTLLPVKIAPMLATLAAAPPTSGSWIYEIKFDGYRMMARIESDGAAPSIRMLTRGGHDWAAKMPGLVAAIDSLGMTDSWLDGEIVVLNAAGLPDFNALQNAFDRPARGRATIAARSDAIVYFVFDAPFLHGEDLRGRPLSERRARLENLFEQPSAAATDRVRLSSTFNADPASILASACAMGLEGVMAKRADSTYVSDRAATWLKLKCRLKQDFVIAGWTDQGADGLANLLLGVYAPDGRFVFAGRVGTGWSVAQGKKIRSQILPLEVDAPAFAAGAGAKRDRWSKRPIGRERWVNPEIVVEINFMEWPEGGQLRHASFSKLKPDASAASIKRSD